MLDLDDAFQILEKAASQKIISMKSNEVIDETICETISLKECLGRTLACDVYSVEN